jgi:hypothetical protein
MSVLTNSRHWTRCVCGYAHHRFPVAILTAERFTFLRYAGVFLIAPALQVRRADSRGAYARTIGWPLRFSRWWCLSSRCASGGMGGRSKLHFKFVIFASNQRCYRHRPARGNPVALAVLFFEPSLPSRIGLGIRSHVFDGSCRTRRRSIHSSFCTA